MAAKTAFGKRADLAPSRVAWRAPAPIRSATPASATPAEPAGSALDVFHAGSIPILTIGLILLLWLIFALEVRQSGDGGLSPSVANLKAMGGLNGKLVFSDRQWWRLLTAPLLHGSLSHLIGNCVALALAGFFLEPMLGGPWFLALFVLAALGGSAGSLAQNDPNIVSVGASGAIMGVMALSFLLSGRAPDAKRAKAIRWISLRIGVPAILPVFLTGGLHSHVDYGAHIGGFLAGGLVWIFLGLIWPRNQPRPALAGVATLLAAGGGAGALVALGLAMAAPAPAAEASTLIPTTEMPRSDEDAMKRSAELVTRYGDDPRAHYMRALYFLAQRDRSDAAEQLRTGIALMPRHASELNPDLTYRMSMTLALIVRSQGDRDAARSIAAEACAAPDTQDWKVRVQLVSLGVC